MSQKLRHFGEVSKIIGHDASFEHVPRKERKELTTFELPCDLQWSSTCTRNENEKRLKLLFLMRQTTPAPVALKSDVLRLT